MSAPVITVAFRRSRTVGLRRKALTVTTPPATTPVTNQKDRLNIAPA